METGPEEFVGAGKDFRVSFSTRSASSRVRLASVNEGKFENGKWIARRWLNGDEKDQGSYWQFDVPVHCAALWSR